MQLTAFHPSLVSSLFALVGVMRQARSLPFPFQDKLGDSVKSRRWEQRATATGLA